jgi:hypothetical protein
VSHPTGGMHVLEAAEAVRLRCCDMLGTSGGHFSVVKRPIRRRIAMREGCTKLAQSGGIPHCIAHGGGKRCQEEDCTNSAAGDTGFCVAHGGGRRCQHAGCPKAAASGGMPHFE